MELLFLIINNTVLHYHIFFIFVLFIMIILQLKKHEKKLFNYYCLIIALCAILGIVFINCTNMLDVPFFSKKKLFWELLNTDIVHIIYLVEMLLGGGTMIIMSIIYGIYGAFLGAIGCYIHSLIIKNKTYN